MLTLGRFQKMAYWVKKKLVSKLIKKHRTLPMRLHREVQFCANKVIIRDHIDLTGKFKLSTLNREAKVSTIHMGSSRYFHQQEMDLQPLEEGDLAEELTTKRSVTVERNIPLG